MARFFTKSKVLNGIGWFGTIRGFPNSWSWQGCWRLDGLQIQKYRSGLLCDFQAACSHRGRWTNCQGNPKKDKHASAQTTSWFTKMFMTNSSPRSRSLLKHSSNLVMHTMVLPKVSSKFISKSKRWLLTFRCHDKRRRNRKGRRTHRWCTQERRNFGHWWQAPIRIELYIEKYTTSRRHRATAILKLNQKLWSGFTRYLEPTVLTNVPRDSLALTDETFGPRESYSHRDSYIWLIYPF